MKTLICIETGKKTKFNENVEPWELDDILDNCANILLRRESDHSPGSNDFVSIRANKLRSEIFHGLNGLTEHLGEFRTFKII